MLCCNTLPGYRGVVEKTFVRGNLVFEWSTAAQPARIGRVMQRGEEI